jgi:hypothetical protein
MTTSTYGPVEVVALGFPGERVPDTVQEAVLEVLADGVVTLLDVAPRTAPSCCSRSTSWDRTSG